MCNLEPASEESLDFLGQDYYALAYAYFILRRNLNAETHKEFRLKQKYRREGKRRSSESKNIAFKKECRRKSTSWKSYRTSQYKLAHY